VPEIWNEEPLALSGALFLQVNRASAALLERHVLDLAGDVSGRQVVDAYCGVGLHARRLARRGARVIGLELDPHAVAVARSDAPAGAEFRQGRVEELLPAALPADLLILNPPRAGVAAPALAAVLREPAGRVLYISCDPATLARDLARMSPTYDLRSLHCFDLFPQTSHVETVAELACSTT
jgi:23S rRNA (uracil1939-C5)-methyltransferase